MSTGVFHHTTYYKWRAPNVIESFQGLEAEKPVTWRRQASHRRKMEEGPKHWAQPTMPLPVDHAVQHLARDLSRSMGCHVHVLVLDAQWYVGGPKAKLPSSGWIYRYKRQRWFKSTRKACHAAFWLGSPKILLVCRLPYLPTQKRGHRHFLKFIIAVANMYIGPDSFLKAVRVELKGRLHGRKHKRRISRIAGWGDSLVADARTVRSYWRDIPTRRGVDRLRITFFYASSVVEQEDNVQYLSHWLEDLKPLPEGPGKSAKNKPQPPLLAVRRRRMPRRSMSAPPIEPPPPLEGREPIFPPFHAGNLKSTPAPRARRGPH